MMQATEVQSLKIQLAELRAELDDTHSHYQKLLEQVRV